MVRRSSRAQQEGFAAVEALSLLRTDQAGSIRLIEAPQPGLKDLQRRLLAGILEEIQAHTAVHGFLKGCSIKTYVSPHVGQRVVLKMDLEDFFPSISRARVQALFRTMGYPESVADLLGGICTTSAPHQYGRICRKVPQPLLPSRICVAIASIAD